MALLTSLLTANGGLGLLWFLVLLPAGAGLACLFAAKAPYALRALLFFLAACLNLFFSWLLYGLEEFTMLIPWAGFEINLAFRVYPLSQLMLLAGAGLVFLVAVYSLVFMQRRSFSGRFFFYFLWALALANGAFLANNFVALLFFWEALTVVVFGLLLSSESGSVAAARKALTLNCISDSLLILGVALTCMRGGTLMMDVVAGLPAEGEGALGFVCLLLGAAGRAGALPFHSWIAGAAEEAPLPFTALLPACLEKLLGAYLLVRVCLDFYAFQPGSPLSVFVMLLGLITLLPLACLALVQRNIKRLLSFLSGAQVGLLILGLGTALPAGVSGGLLCLLNQGISLICLLLAAGAVEYATGTASLKKLSGIGRLMPLTGLCFLLAALSLVGAPPFCGFYAQQLIFDAAYQSGLLYYIPAMLALQFMAMALLRLGHACFFGPLRLPEGLRREQVSEAPGAMLLPMGALALGGLVTGLFNGLPLGAIRTALSGADWSGWPSSLPLVLITGLVLLLAVLNHIIGYRATGQGLAAADHIHYLPGVYQLYDAAERQYLDPYNIFIGLTGAYAWLCRIVDRSLSWINNNLPVRLASACASAMHAFSSGVVNQYLLWALAGMGFLILLFLVLV